eukprot:6335706-Amphidinium_carterae.1
MKPFGLSSFSDLRWLMASRATPVFEIEDDEFLVEISEDSDFVVVGETDRAGSPTLRWYYLVRAVRRVRALQRLWSALGSHLQRFPASLRDRARQLL